MNTSTEERNGMNGPAPAADRGAPTAVREWKPVGTSAAMREVLAAADDVASANTTVLLLGESGTGKEVVARYIHRQSSRGNGAWVAVNCAALPADLLESELFGHERGAFTGANDRRIGRIEQADGGTLLLDEISELPAPLQAKLLRVLQEREVDRVGGTRPIPVDVRIIATSNRSLEDMVAAKSFRADLYYRLCVFPIVLPPLRERAEDVPILAEHFLDRLAREMGRGRPALAPDARASLMAHAFPGNARELRNVLERALVRCRQSTLMAEHLDPMLAVNTARARRSTGTPLPPPPTTTSAHSSDAPWELPVDLSALERLAITEALRRVDGNRTHAARLLGISLRTLRNKLRLWRGEATSADGQTLPGDESFSADDDSGASDLDTGELAQSSHHPGRDTERAA